MANQKISALTAATTLNDTDDFLLRRGSTNVRISQAALRKLFSLQPDPWDVTGPVPVGAADGMRYVVQGVGTFAGHDLADGDLVEFHSNAADVFVLPASFLSTADVDALIDARGYQDAAGVNAIMEAKVYPDVGGALNSTAEVMWIRQDGVLYRVLASELMKVLGAPATLPTMANGGIAIGDATDSPYAGSVAVGASIAMPNGPALGIGSGLPVTGNYSINLGWNQTGANNFGIRIGYGNAVGGGSEGTCVGYFGAASGSYYTGVGAYSIVGDYGVSFGHGAECGDSGVSVGAQSIGSINSVSVGRFADSRDVGGNGNVSIGYSANCNGLHAAYNVAVGSLAFAGNSAGVTGRNGNTVIGYNAKAGDNVTAGSLNSVVVGARANLHWHTTSSVLVGADTFSSAGGQAMTAIGYGAGGSAESFAGGVYAYAYYRSVCVGAYAGTTGNFDDSFVAVGYSAGANAFGKTARGESVLVGALTSVGAFSGVAVGYSATVQMGANNGVAIGKNADCYNQYAVAWQYAQTFNTFEHQSRNIDPTAGRRMACGAAVTTTNDTPSPMNGIVVPDNAACGFRGQISAYRSAGAGTAGDSAMWEVSGLVKKVAGTATLVGVTIGAAGLPTFNEAGAATWAITAGISGNTLVFTATGETGETIRWEATVNFTTTA